MKFEPIEFRDKQNRTITLRSADVSDAEDLIHFMKTATAETLYLIREPDEFQLSLEEEQAFIQNIADHPKALLLIAETDGQHIGNCSLQSLPYRRYRHRCELAIALYQKYCNAGIGKTMLQTVLSLSRQAGYEQAELEVIQDNKNAIALYQKLGFEKYGAFPHNMKYADGRYADAWWMMKQL